MMTEDVDNKMIMDTYLVVYLDFLGISDLMKNDDGTLLNQIFGLYSLISKTLSDRKIKGISDVKMKMFSDNLVLATRYDENIDFNTFYVEKLHGLLLLTSLLQLRSLEEFGLLIRGGITIGKFYIDENFVWGPALVDGYLLESKVAQYPRVIINSSLIDVISQKVQELAEREDNKYVEDMQAFIRRDVDNIHFIDYHHATLSIKKILEKRTNLEKQGSVSEMVSIAAAASFVPKRLKFGKEKLLTLIANCPDIRAYQKIAWAVNYHNSFCKRINAQSHYLIPDSLCPQFPLHKSQEEKS